MLQRLRISARDQNFSGRSDLLRHVATVATGPLRLQGWRRHSYRELIPRNVSDVGKGRVVATLTRSRAFPKSRPGSLAFVLGCPNHGEMSVLRSGPFDPNAALLARRRAAQDRYRVGQAIGQTCVLLAVLWWIHAIRAIGDLDLSWAAIRPGAWSGLVGVFTAPLLHGSFGHLVSNTVPLLLLGSMARYAYPRALLYALPLIWITSGLGTWLFGRPSLHLGASGVAHGLMFFLFIVGLLRRDRLAIVVALLTFFLYGSMIWTIFPGEPGVSWEAHLYGAVGGVLAAVLLRGLDPLPYRAPYSWELEPDEDEERPWSDDEVIVDAEPVQRALPERRPTIH